MKTSKSLTPQDLEHFQYLIESKCSMRSHEFVCAILEPECRPERMGPFMPCKRICKCMTNRRHPFFRFQFFNFLIFRFDCATAILEACAHVVTSSEMLTATFDCDIYPDSNDENECKDTTRGTVCHSNEFQCGDKTCIPSQWRYDQLCNCTISNAVHSTNTRAHCTPSIASLSAHIYISFTLVSDAIISRIVQMPKTRRRAHFASKTNSSKYHAIACLHFAQIDSE